MEFPIGTKVKFTLEDETESGKIKSGTVVEICGYEPTCRVIEYDNRKRIHCPIRRLTLADPYLDN